MNNDLIHVSLSKNTVPWIWIASSFNPSYSTSIEILRTLLFRWKEMKIIKFVRVVNKVKKMCMKRQCINFTLTVLLLSSQNNLATWCHVGKPFEDFTCIGWVVLASVWQIFCKVWFPSTTMKSSQKLVVGAKIYDRITSD